MIQSATAHSHTNRASSHMMKTNHPRESERGRSVCKNNMYAFFDGTYFDELPSDGVQQLSLHRIAPSWSHIFFALLIIADACMTLSATVLIFVLHPETYRAFNGVATHKYSLYIAIILISISWIISLSSSHTYERHAIGEGYTLYSRIINAGVVDFVLLCALGYIFTVDLPRILAVFVPLLSVALTLVERWTFRQILYYYRKTSRCNYATAIVGSPDGIRKTLAQLQAHKGLGYAPVAICPVVPDPDNPGLLNGQNLVSARFKPKTTQERALQVLTMNSHLPQTMKHLHIESVLVTDVIDRHSEIMRTFSLAVESMGIELAFSSAFAYSTGSALHLRENQTLPIVTASLPQYSATTLIFKRMLDILLAVVAIILSSPVMILISCAIKLDDGGPIYYVQQRVGLLGKPFAMLKFRSMRTDADELKTQLAHEYGIENNFIFKIKEDPRVTRIGKIIRRISLDEIPQFFNVLKGDMSFVGPRPPLPEEVNKYSPLYSSRLLVKPGITGLWQISGRSDLSQEESEQLDVSYVEQWSLSGDIAILMKTVVAVITCRGSY